MLTRGHQLNTARGHECLRSFCERHRLKKTSAAFDTVHLITCATCNIGLVEDGPLALLDPCLVGGHLLEKHLLYSVHLMGGLFSGRGVVWSPIIPNEDALPVSALALALGGHFVIGIGDFHYGATMNNAGLVERVVEFVRTCGREPATPTRRASSRECSPESEGPVTIYL